MMTKTQIRTENLMKRKNIKEKKYKDEKIFNRLISMPFYKNANSVMTYLSYKSEPDTFMLVSEMLKNRKEVSAPVCYGKGLMNAIPFLSLDELHPSSMGILEPKQNFPPVKPEKINLIIVPGCAFNMNGYRIGYGGGFYDRFLSKTSGITCGLFYEALKTEFKEEKNDIPLDYIITEEKLYSFKKGRN